MFSGYAVLGNCAVGLLILLAQGGLLAAFFRYGGLAVNFVQAHVASIDDGFGLGMQPDTGRPEQPEIMAAAGVMGKTDNLARGVVHDELRLQCVALFLARVVAALFF